MGRRRVSDDDRRFRAEIAQQFKGAMKTHGLKNQSEAAKTLNITRQAFSQYLLQKTTPQAEILARACARWNLTLKYRSAEFKRGAFGAYEAKNDHDDTFQLGLFSEPQVFENANLIVSVERAQKTALQITIKMKKAGLPDRRSSRRTATTTRG